DDLPHVAAAVGKGKNDPSVEAQATQQIASGMLQRKAGTRTELPGWLVEGFGRATYYRTVPGSEGGQRDRQAVLKLAKAGKSAKDVGGGGLGAEEQAVMQASLVDYLAYSPANGKFLSFVGGFAPEENVLKKTAEQAFTAAELKPDQVDKGWQAWLAKPK